MFENLPNQLRIGSAPAEENIQNTASALIRDTPELIKTVSCWYVVYAGADTLLLHVCILHSAQHVSGLVHTEAVLHFASSLLQRYPNAGKPWVFGPLRNIADFYAQEPIASVVFSMSSQ